LSRVTTDLRNFCEAVPVELVRRDGTAVLLPKGVVEEWIA
jgi:hypothetical protein